MPTARSAAQRKADERQRHRDAGRVVVQAWIHPSQRARLVRYIEKLMKELERA